MFVRVGSGGPRGEEEEAAGGEEESGGREEEEETDFSPNGTTDVRFRINDKVKKVIVSDVNCEKW